jgi:hypothetical protein
MLQWKNHPYYGCQQLKIQVEHSFKYIEKFLDIVNPEPIFIHLIKKKIDW